MNKVLVINLKSRPDRRTKCLSALKQQGVPEDAIEFYHPLTNRTLIEQNTLVQHMADNHSVKFKDLLDREPMRYLSITNANIDCLTKAAKMDKGERYLILEDDWLLNKKWTDLSAAMTFLDKQDTSAAFVAQLGCEWGYSTVGNFQSPPTKTTSTVIGGFYKDRPMWGCYAYVVNNESAKQMRSKIIRETANAFNKISQFALDVYFMRLLNGISSWTVVENESVFIHNNEGGNDH